MKKTEKQTYVNSRRLVGKRWIGDNTEWTGLKMNESVPISEDRER